MSIIGSFKVNQSYCIREILLKSTEAIDTVQPLFLLAFHRPDAILIGSVLNFSLILEWPFRYIILIYYVYCWTWIWILVIVEVWSFWCRFSSSSRPSAKACLEHVWMTKGCCHRSASAQPQPIPTARLIDFIERRRHQVDLSDYDTIFDNADFWNLTNE